ncbi:MAG: hypothetical protein AAFU57_14820 [Bacteroidota bacterium]
MKKYAHIIVIILIAMAVVVYLKLTRAEIEKEIIKNKYVTTGYVFDEKYGARNVSIIYSYQFKTDTLIASYPVENAKKHMNKTYAVHCDSLKAENHIIFLESPIEASSYESGRIKEVPY